MEQDVAKNYLSVGRSSTPIIRAGVANSIVLALPIGTMVLGQALANLGAPVILNGGVIACYWAILFWTYSRWASRVSVEAGRLLRVVTPLTVTVFAADELASARVHAFRAWWTIVISLRLRSSSRRKLYFLSALQTSAGSLDASRQQLEVLLGQVITPEWRR